MTGRSARAVVFLLACSPATDRIPGAGLPPIRVDGELDEWGAVQAVAGRPAAPSRGGGLSTAPLPSIREIRAADDARALHLALAFDGPVNPQGLTAPLLLAFDADGDPGTGVESFGLPGTDLVVSFTRRLPRGAGTPDAPSVAQGVAAWVPRSEAPDATSVPRDALDPYEIGLAFEPRFRSDRFELSIGKGRVSAAAVALFTGTRARATAVRVDSVGAALPGLAAFEIELRSNRPLPDARATLERAPGTAFRAVTWNVSRENMVEIPEAFRRILEALAPDLVLLDEIPAAAGEPQVVRLLPGAGGPSTPWSIHLGTSGSRQRSAIAARAPVSPAVGFRRVPYPDSIRTWLDGPASADMGEVREGLEGAGVPAAGAWVELGGRRLLAVAVDLVCCGNSPRDPEDRIRRVEAEAIRAAARAELENAGSREPGATARGPTGGGPALILGGDLNLVGSRAPLESLLRGLDPGGGDLEPVRALQLDGATTATWRAGAGPFPPGRLDYVLYGPARLEVGGAFVFDTRDLPRASLARLGLRPGDSERASDHLPIVVDFAWR